MKIIHKNLKKREVKVQAQNPEDLWYLSYLIEPEDTVEGSSERKIKIGDSDDRKVKIVRKRVFLKLKVEKLELKDDILRVSGTILEGPDDVSHGSYHTFNLEENSIVKIIKQDWLNFQLEKLNQAVSRVKFNILVMVFDREEAIFFRIREQGHSILTKLKGNVSKKGVEEKGDNFYKEIIKVAEAYDKKNEFKNIIIASPSFWKEYLMKEVSEELKKKITLATCSSVSDNSISEIMKRPELQTVLEKERNSKELLVAEDFLENLSKEKACYGIKECEEKVNIGAVETLVVSENFISTMREAKKYKRLEYVMKNCENMKGKVFILSSEEAKKKVDALGGVGGVLRWKS